MNQEKLETIVGLFEGKEIRSIWDSEKEDYYFSVVDVVNALANPKDARKYWSVLKSRLKKEGSEVTTNCSQLKMLAPDGKMRLRDAMKTNDILRLIESIPSPKAEPFKMWLANLGSERIDEVFDPEIAIKRAINYYRKRGYSDKWIEARLKGILDRNKLTDIWKEGGITENYEYGILTNEIYKEWSGMKANEYKAYKGIRKESLRDNMSDIEVALTDLGEIATRELAKEHKPYGLEQNKKIGVYYTRVDDSNPSFDSRVDLANKADADLFISVHNNSTTGPGLSQVEGTQVMYDEKKPDKDSKDFAQICLEEVTKSCGSVDKGLVAGNDIFIIRTAAVPVALIEVGFMTNEEELTKLNSNDYQKKVAEGIYQAILRAFEEGY